MSHDQYLYRYIQSANSPKGQWHVNVPSGILTAKKEAERSNTGRFDKEGFISYALNRAKEIDAVCVASQPNHQHVSWKELDHDKKKYVDTGVFDGESIFLVEAKTTEEGLFKGLGQLKTYSTHFRNYWDAKRVEEILVLLGDDVDEYYIDVNKELPVKFAVYPEPEKQL